MSKKNSGLRLTHLWQFTQVSGDLRSTLSAKRQQGWAVTKGRKGGRHFHFLSPVSGGWSRSPPALEVGEIVAKRSPW